MVAGDDGARRPFHRGFSAARQASGRSGATNPLVMWVYTNLPDKRWVFTKKYMTLKQDPNNTEAQKIGLFNPDTWGAYVLNNVPVRPTHLPPLNRKQQ